MLNSLGVVTLILLLVVVAFSAFTSNYFYASMTSNLETRAASATSFISTYKVRSEYDKALAEYVETFQDAAQIELQYLTSTGTVSRSSNGLTISGAMPSTPDVAQAMQRGELTTYMGKNPSTGERVLSVTSPLMSGDEVVGMMRAVTSLRLVDRQVTIVCALAVVVGIAILALIYFFNAYFLRSIVDSVVKITGIAKRIAAGSYGIQLEQKGEKTDDEIDELTIAINEMSRSIMQAETMKSEFITSVSHELRTPLTAINGWAETIMNGEARDSEDIKKGMGIIASEARRLTSMVEELLEFSRIEDGRFTLSVEPMDLRAELEDAVYTYREFFASEGIRLTHHDCEEDFPRFSGDPARLRQVFCNLLDNAAKHGGNGRRIETAIFPQDDQVVITVRDYGPGIPVDELPLVTTKFYKGRTTTSRGSGIGLAVCQEIVGRHGGEFTIQNAKGGGCVASIRLKSGT